MKLASFRDQRAAIAFACFAIGAGVAAALSPRGDFFLPNFLTFWCSQLVVLACLAPFRPRAEVVAGASLALATYLAAFGYWSFSQAHPEAMAWLGYFFSLPGAIVGAVVTGLNQVRVPKPFMLGLAAFAMVLIGVAINQVVVCSTVMYCGQK